MTSLPVRQVPQTQSPALTLPFFDPSLGRLRNALGWVSGKPVLMTGFHLTDKDRQRLESWQASLRRRLSPSGTDAKEKAVELAKLTSGFPVQGMDDMTSDLRVEMYFEAIEKLPGWAVREARLAVVAGTTQFGRPFGPGPIEFADLVRSIVKPLQDDLRDVSDVLAAGNIAEEATADSRARISEGFDKLRNELRPAVSEEVVRDEAVSGLRQRAQALGHDFEALMKSIPDADKRSGTFSRLDGKVRT